MESVQELIIRISPTICLPGGEQLAQCIYQMKEWLEKNHSPDKIRVMKDVYAPAAVQLNRSKDSIIKAVARAIDVCWMDGRNAELNKIIGTLLPLQPAPKEFMMYCAYYLVYKKAYHETKLPMLF